MGIGGVVTGKGDKPVAASEVKNSEAISPLSHTSS
jgi:hypothetical protein